MNRIMVAVDGSDYSCHAARFAARLARDSSAQLTLFYAYDTPRATSLGLRTLSPGEIERAMDRVSRAAFESAKSAIGDLDVKMDQCVSFGDPVSEIVAFADSHEVDLIVVGSRGLSQVKGMLVGSVSNRLVHRAHCPVAVVR